MESKTGWKQENNPRMKRHYFDGVPYSLCGNNFMRSKATVDLDDTNPDNCKMCVKILISLRKKHEKQTN